MILKRKWMVLAVVCCLAYTVSNASETRKALLAGVNEYLHKDGRKLKNLEGPVNDVELVRREILPVLGYRPDQIRVILNAEANKKGILDGLKWLTAGAASERLFYFAGHGSTVEDLDGDDKDGCDEVVLPYDAFYSSDGKLNIDSVITDDEFYFWFNKIKGKKLLAVLDSCYSGTGFRSVGSVPGINVAGTRYAYNVPRGVGGTEKEFSLFEPDNLNDSLDESIPDGHIYLYSALKNQTAIERDFEGNIHGCFTMAFSEAVRSAAMASSRKESSYLDVYMEIDTIMKQKLNLIQTPVIQPKYRGPERAKYEGTPSGRLLDAMVRSAGNTKKAKTELPGAETYRSRVLIAHRGKKILSASDLKSLAPYADIDLNAGRKSGYTLYATVSAGASTVELTNENGYRVNQFDYMDKRELIAQLERRIKHHYLKELLAAIQSGRGLPLSISILHRNKAYELNDFYLGQCITFVIKSDIDAYVYVLSVDAGDQMNLILPYSAQPDNRIRKGGTILLPDKKLCGEECVWEIGQEPGEEIVKVIAVPKKLDIQMAKVRKDGEDELLTELTFDEALRLIKSISKQLKTIPEWHDRTLRYMNYTHGEYRRMHPNR